MGTGRSRTERTSKITRSVVPYPVVPAASALLLWSNSIQKLLCRGLWQFADEVGTMFYKIQIIGCPLGQRNHP